MTTPKKILIGIDPGQNTGIAIIQNGIISLHTLDFWATIDLFTKSQFAILKPFFKVIIEDCNLNKTTHGRDKLERNVLDRKAQNVGMVKLQTTLYIQFLTKEGIEFVKVRPSSKKLDAKTFKTITKYQGRTNQHERDSAMLIWGR